MAICELNGDGLKEVLDAACSSEKKMDRQDLQGELSFDSETKRVVTTINRYSAESLMQKIHTCV